MALVPLLRYAFPDSWFSTPSVLTLCLKDPQLGSDTIYVILLTSRVVHWKNLPQKQEKFSDKN